MTKDTLTAPQRIRRAILLSIEDRVPKIKDAPLVLGDEIREVYSRALDGDASDSLLDAEEEFRGNFDCETDIPAPSSRHYESKSVAKRIDGVWVGWTYWYGGGKHGEPYAVDWIDDAYILDVTEEEKLVTVRTFKRSKRNSL